MCERCGRNTQAEVVVVESDKGKLFAVVNGKGSTYCMTMVCTSEGYANSVCANHEGYRVEEFDCPEKPEVAPYPVYVVSVGEDEKYRIVDLLLIKKLAQQLAASLRGTVSTYKVTASTPEATDTRFYKWFIPLGPCNQDEEYYYRDSFRQRVLRYENQEVPPTVSRRRRYDDGLPYRLEITDTKQERCGNIAEQIHTLIENGDLTVDSLEYNVEYTLVFNQDKDTWEIDPCLL